MTNTTVSRLGQINHTGDVDALFLKIFGGEVIVSFDRNTVFKDRHTVRQITNAKSAQFPFIGQATASYHTPGNFIDGQKIDHAEKTIGIDDLLVAPTFIANIDEAMNHYDARQPYSKELGRILAQTFDINVARMMVKAARAANPVSGRAGGSTIDHEDMATDSDVLGKAIFAAAQVLDEKDVPDTERYGFFKPGQYYLLAQNKDLINKDWGGAGEISKGSFQSLANIEIVKTNNVPSTNVATGPTKYQGDYTKVVGIVANKRAAATVKLMDLAMESEYEIRRQGTFMVAKYAVGHDWLQPDCAVELATGASGDTSLTPTTR